MRLGLKKSDNALPWGFNSRLLPSLILLGQEEKIVTSYMSRGRTFIFQGCLTGGVAFGKRIKSISSNQSGREPGEKIVWPHCSLAFGSLLCNSHWKLVSKEACWCSSYLSAFLWLQTGWRGDKGRSGEANGKLWSAPGCFFVPSAAVTLASLIYLNTLGTVQL